jgi:MFS family permease
MFGLDLIGRGDPHATRSAVLVGVGIGVAALSVWHAGRVKHPLLDFSLLRIPTFASSVWGGTCVRLIIGTTPFLWGLLFQVGFGMSALGTGLLLLTCAVGDVGSRPFTTRAVRRFGFRTVLTRDALLLAAGILGCALLTPRTPLAATIALLLFIGVVRSLAFTAINTLAYADVPTERMSAATSLASTLQQLSFGISVAFAAIVLHAAARLHHERGGVFSTADFQIAFCAVAVIGLAAVYNFAKLTPDAGHIVSGHRTARLS